jgi:aspartyl-tRNA(Asn)/glutamyl-tRNA(Gln) amidotransferase subunit A
VPPHSPRSAAPAATEPWQFDLLASAALLRARTLSAAELLESCLRRIETVNGGEPSFDGAPDAINAWVRLYPEHARDSARNVDRHAHRATSSPLAGIPTGLKDLFAVSGLPLTASSRVLEGNVPARDSVAWSRLKDLVGVARGNLTPGLPQNGA